MIGKFFAKSRFLPNWWRKSLIWLAVAMPMLASAQVNTDQVLNVGRNAMYFDDYVLAIQYFNQAIQAKPYLDRPYFYRAVAKLNLDDFAGAEADASRALELNPFITDAWEARGVARQNQGNDAGAVDDYAHALALLPHNRQILHNMAAAQTSAGMLAEADSSYAQLIKHYPGFENAYLGRARLRLAQKDTTRALADIDHALQINDNSFNAHVMAADLAMRSSQAEADTFASALNHLQAAIKLQPRLAGLYVNRAYLRYRQNDWFGAMDDYDYALQLDPVNQMALFNRGILAMETSSWDRATHDFSRVLEMDPNDFRARYNRAVAYAGKHQYAKAVDDASHVIEAFPDFPTGYMMRSEYERAQGNLAAAQRDANRAKAITARLHPDKQGKIDTKNPNEPDTDTEPSPEAVRRQFASLLTVDDNTDFRDEYNNSAIRGRVQDKNLTIETEPMIELAYYTSTSEVKPSTYYIKEIDDLNSTRELRHRVLVTNRVPRLDDDDIIDRHFKSIKYYNSYLATHQPRAIDFIARALDFVTVRDYASAIRDLDRAIALTPDYAPAYMLRAQSRHRQIQSGAVADEAKDAASRDAIIAASRDDMLADIDRVIALTPRNAFAWFNRGNAMLEIGDLNAAMQAYNQAIDLKPDFGEAYYNRGYTRLKSGQRAQGIADMGRAGELGIVAAYNLMKRISNPR